ncbi:MAG: efflux RND transporter periplasmic adaptor subunit [Planctomycetota bacterium]|nr:efflux RND transporter periplasmic adaptor subunit [Planctomycetaceae bacterium]MDQ3330723.1 efflux RND transporter periplasmic adaptor subunit [Planctomycetota bacterium]
MTDARLWSQAILLALLPLAAGCENGAAIPTLATAVNTSNDESASPEPVLAGPAVRKALVLTTSQPGRIEAYESAPLHAKVSGYVSEVLVDIGDRVEKGQTLVRLAVPELEDDRRQKQALLAQAKAEVRQAQAAQKAVEAGLTSSQAATEQAKAGVARAEAEYERWRAESGRLDALAATGSVTQKVADETRNQFRAADAARKETNAAIRSAEAAVAEAQAGIEKAKADVVAAEARQAVAEADLGRAETMLAYAEIKAPFDGVITIRNIDTGHLIPLGGASQPLVAVARADRVRVFLEVPEVEAAKVDNGDPAAVRVQALDGLEIAGEVTRTSWALDTANRTLSTEIDVDNAEGRLRPGMYATATIRLAQRENALTLPVTAITRKPEGAFCFILRDGEAVMTPVKLGLRVGGDWEIASGLSGNETVALTKADSLQDGQAVEPVAPSN